MESTGKMPTEAIILSAGEGMRLKPLSDEVPKCLVRIKGKTLLEYQLEHLRSFGINRVVVTIPQSLATRTISELEELREDEQIILSIEDEILGTAGGLRQALAFIESAPIVLNADDLADVNINDLSRLGTPTISITQIRSPFGIISIDGNQAINFKEKPLLPYFTSLGWYYLPKQMVLPEKGSLERDVFPRLAREGLLKIYIHQGRWTTINTLKDIMEAECEF